jgi:hypothetical protein
MKQILKYLLPSLVVGLIIFGTVGAAVITPYFGGGTGTSTAPSVGSLLYGVNITQYGVLPVGSDGQVLKVSGGIPSWGSDNTGGGGSGTSFWTTSTDETQLYPTDLDYLVGIGTSTPRSLLTVGKTGNGLNVDDSGNLGIGIWGMTYPLSIYNSQNGLTAAWLNNPNTGTAGQVGMYLNSDSVNLFLSSTGSGNTGTFGASSAQIGTLGDDPLSLLTANTKRLTILGTGTYIGYVGIATSSPTHLLEVNGTIYGEGLQLNGTIISGTWNGAEIADAYLVDTLTASNYVRKSTWTDLNDYPSACGAGQYVSAIGDTLTCSTPAGSGGFSTTTNDYWFNNTAGITGNTGITTLGTITTGIWNGTDIQDQYLATTYASQAYASTTYVMASDWTTIDSYPAGCGAGQYVSTIGDTLTCSTPAGSGGFSTTTNDYWLSTKTTANLTENTNLYYTDARARLSVSETITGIDYTSGTGVFSITSGYGIPLTASTTQYWTAYGWGNHALGGYLTAVASDSTWTTHNSYPAACSAGSYVSAIGDTLTCSVPAGSGTTVGSKWTRIPNLIYPTTTTDNVLIGGSATTSRGYDLEVIGNSLFDGIVASASSTFASSLEANSLNVVSFGASALSIKAVSSTLDPKLSFYTGTTPAEKFKIAVDTNDGNHLVFATSTGIDIMSINQNGRVSIGTNSSPLAPLHIGSGTSNYSVDTQVLISRDVNSTKTGNGHGYSDSSRINRSGTIGYNSYDARIVFYGAYDYDHYSAFQASPSYSSTGDMDYFEGFASAPEFVVGYGTTTSSYAFHAYNPTGSGGVANNYGLYIDSLTRGYTSNFAVYTAGTTKSYFGGNVGIATTSPSSLFSVGSGAGFQIGSTGTVVKGTWNGTSISDAYVDDTITASNYVRTSTWTDINNYPTGCTNQFVRTIGDTLTCATVDMSADTNLTALAPLTITADRMDLLYGFELYTSATSTLRVKDLYISNTGDIGTGVYDFGGATSFEIPNEASPTIDATGEIAVDTTSGQIQYYDGTAKRAILPATYPAFTYTTTTWSGTTTIPLGTAFVAETWNSVQCYTDAGTLRLNFNDGTNKMTNVNASTTAGTVTLSSNNTFTASEKRYATIGTPASSPTKISCTIKKFYDVD